MNNLNVKFNLQELQRDSIIFFGSILAAIGVLFDLIGSAMVDNNNNAPANASLDVAWWYFTAYILTLLLVVFSAAGNAMFKQLQIVFLTLSLAYLPTDINLSILASKSLVRAWNAVEANSKLKTLYDGFALRSAGLIILALVWFIQIIYLTINNGKVAPAPSPTPASQKV